MKIFNKFSRDYYWLILVVGILALLPNLFNFSQFQITVSVYIILWALLGTAWNIMGGYAGQFSFGHSAYFGIGAYTSIVMLNNFGISPWIGMFVGALFAGLFGLLSGFLTFRYGLKGPYFVLATFAFAEMLRLIASETEFINTSIGLHVPLLKADSWAMLQFNDAPQNYYFAILLLMTFAIAVNIAIANSKRGFYFQAIREDEEAAAALGVNLLTNKTTAVVISAFLSALGGAFFVQFFRFVNPDLAFGVSISIEILLRPIVGGIGTIWGPLVGALFLTPLSEFTRTIVRNPPLFLSFIKGRTGIDKMLFGLILILVILFMPDGIVGAFNRLRKKLKRKQ